MTTLTIFSQFITIDKFMQHRFKYSASFLATPQPQSRSALLPTDSAYGKQKVSMKDLKVEINRLLEENVSHDQSHT